MREEDTRLKLNWENYVPYLNRLDKAIRKITKREVVSFVNS